MLKEKIIEFRKAKDLTQQDLADLMKVSRNSVTNWETGKREPRAADIRKLALILGVPPNDFFSDVPDVIDVPKNIQIMTTTEQPRENFAYWGGVLDEAKKVAQSGDEQERSLIASLLKRAYETLISKIDPTEQEIVSATTQTVINHGSVFGEQNAIKIETTGV